MCTPETYRKDPCRTLSIPYWKHIRMTPPAHIRICHAAAFDPALLDSYIDTPYFRLYHDLQSIPQCTLPDYTLRQAVPDDLPLIADLINRAYTDLSVTENQLRGYTQTPVYTPDLWLIASEKNTGLPVGCALADLDPDMREGILEWVQVLPARRRKGIGRLLVCTLLGRMVGRADFVTVSGKVSDSSSPERLYRACGFAGKAVWHILTQK